MHAMITPAPDANHPKIKRRNLWNSLTTRVSLIMLVIVMTGMWSLSLYMGRMLRLDMQSQLGGQQFSTASFIAAHIDREFAIRLDALQKVAVTVTQDHLKQPERLQQLMAQLPVLQSLFNAGTYATSLSGVPVASVLHPATPQVGSSADARQIEELLRTIAPLAIFLSDRSPSSVLMAVPLHDQQGRRIGALVGVTQLSAVNFLDTIAGSRYGQTGGYLLYSLQQHRVVMASAANANPGATSAAKSELAMEPMMRNQDGSDIGLDSGGVEVLVSRKRIPLADWSISVMLPTQEAFAPVREQSSRLLIATWALTLLTGLLAWWVLRRQLAPIVGTVKTLANLPFSVQPMQPLALTRQFEIDSLIEGFNRLLDILRQRNEALMASIALNKNTLDSVAAHIAVLDSNGIVRGVNQPWQHYLAQVHGGPVEAIAAGLHYRTLFLDEGAEEDATDLPDIFAAVQSVLDGKQLLVSVEYPVHALQNVHWFYLSVTPLGAEKKGVVISRADITERKRAVEELRKLSRVAEQAPLSIVITDLHGAIEYTNPYFSEKTGYAMTDVVGKNPRILKSGLTTATTYKTLWETLGARRVWRGELHNKKKSGELFIERVVIAPVLNSAGSVTHYVALKEDITQEKQREKNRLSLTSRIEELSRRLVRTQEDARLRFSQELHDRTSPNLAALRINLDMIAKATGQAPGGQDFFDRIDDTRALIEDTTASIREICAGLHPAAIERAGLLGVVQSYSQQFAKRAGVTVNVHCSHEEIRLPADMELALFRVVQEALTNCAKHAQASNIEIAVKIDAQPLVLSIFDDGCGFDIAQMVVSGTLNGLGLINMRETVEFAGGSFRVESTPGQGTRIYIEI